MLGRGEGDPARGGQRTRRPRARAALRGAARGRLRPASARGALAANAEVLRPPDCRSPGVAPRPQGA
eukprot:7374736-Lingulodinium_polyedra.AAC.1